MKIVRDDEYDKVWQSKRLNNGDFDYYFHIVMTDLGSYTREKGYWLNVYASKAPEFLEEEDLYRLMKCFGLENREDVTPYDVCDYGIRAVIEKTGVKTRTEALQKVREFRKQIPLYEMLFGFYMDRPQNAIGNDGWNFINGYIGFQYLEK